METAAQLLNRHQASTSSSSSTRGAESREQTADVNDSAGKDKTHIEFVPNPSRRPILLDGPVTISPTNSKDSITRCEYVSPGQFHYIVSRRSGHMIVESFAVDPPDILDHVSAAELEDFESREARDERRRMIELRRMKLADTQNQPARPYSSYLLGGLAITRSPEGFSNDDLPIQNGARKRASGKSHLKSQSRAAPKKQKMSKPKRNPSQTTSEEEEFEVEAIVNHEENRGKRMFLVKWVGYPDVDNTWLPERELRLSARELVNEYLLNMTETYEIERIIAHEHDKEGELFFRVQWKSYPGEDTWEPENELPQDLVQDFLSSNNLISTFTQKPESRSPSG